MNGYLKVFMDEEIEGSINGCMNGSMNESIHETIHRSICGSFHQSNSKLEGFEFIWKGISFQKKAIKNVYP